MPPSDHAAERQESWCSLLPATAQAARQTLMAVLLIPLQSLRCVLFTILSSESGPARFRAVLAALSFEQALAVAVLLVLNMVLEGAAMTRFKGARLMGGRLCGRRD
ncbi:MAG: hypothetical protein H5T62_03275 [Anaerolineae bacterium]|nr:hypothetical protein [Anaerolineae bacterium]